jgi:anaerobic selenocysteine-containing dehydrogenase
MLSPMMACEEAWLLGQVIRGFDPKAVLVSGPIPTTGADETFKNYLTGKQTFVIKAEKVPNAAGIRRVMQLLGGPTATFDDLVASTKPEIKNLKGGWIVGGYSSNWIPADSKQVPGLFKKGYRVIQDVLPNSLVDSADIVLPAAAWAEKDGCWENYQGKVQAFLAAISPVEGARREGDVYLSLLARRGLYNAESIRQEMGPPFNAVEIPAVKGEEPVPEFVEL